mgnify:CR=1 FL=1|uniref:Restriction endonuclease n=1 Tax=viral metagenome TaxID=1070528 RepID=A0A6C0FA19_9ZZZZ|tara:strand:- start:2443 stop:3069 length:627 start_codon:yes stop_codon:yes gene_type:complete
MSELHATEENTQLITTQSEINSVSTNLKECVEWALTKPPDIIKQSGVTIAKQKEEAKEKEKKWGNKMIGKTDNKQWTTGLGERLVKEILKLRGENPRKPECKGGFQPDWETDKNVYEVKTSNWRVEGTAGEKVLGTWIKYQDIPELYGKPLKIVCVAYQEEELKNGKTRYFGDNITKKTQEILDLAKSWGIEYVCFSDLVSPILDKIN